MNDRTLRADRMRQRWIWAFGLVLMVSLALAFAYKQARVRLNPPMTAAATPASKPDDFESYQKTNSGRDEAQVAQDRAAYDAYQAAHQQPVAAKP